MPSKSLLQNLVTRFRQPIILALHLSLIPLGFFAAFALRFDAPVPREYLDLFWSTVVFLLPIRLLSFAVFGLYRGWWRHVGMQDIVDLVRAVTVSSALFVVALFLTGGLTGFPRSILILDWVIAIGIFSGIRFTVRLAREKHQGWNGVERRVGKAALIVGAGEAAERLLRQLRRGGGEFRAVGLVDDAFEKRGMRLHGVPVLGPTDDLPRLVAKYGVDMIVIAIPSASPDQMQQIVGRCVEAKVEFKIVPPLHELIDGRARLNQLRNVELADLLGRDSVSLDLRQVRADLAGKVVLITGAAGSIGSELARQVAGFGPARLLILDRAESLLYFTDLELERDHPDLEIVPLVADVTDASRMRQLFSVHEPHYVLHAAAYKHVPLMESNVAEAVRNNILGTLCVADCSIRSKVEKFVLISTDKAVHPSSVMGATKRVAERIVLGWPELRASRTDFRAVRFGNVLGSDGSVVPLFQKQLKQGGPLTVTDPEVSRYFMTIPEAVQLVLQAAALPEAAGRISMLEMGDPVRIVELAENLIKLSGLEPYKDVPIVFTGLRPGEKLHEELMSGVEESIPTRVEKIRIVQTDETDGQRVVFGVDQLASAAAVNDSDGLLRGLCDLVPECVPPLRSRGAACRVSRPEEPPSARSVRLPDR